MKARIFAFIEMLRELGLLITVAETLDALAAVRFTGVEREALRSGLGATLLKDEADRPSFDTAFERCFPLIPEQHRRPRLQPARAGETPSTGKRGGPFHPTSRPEAQPQEDDNQRSPLSRLPESIAPSREVRHLIGTRRIQNILFEQMSPRDIEECDQLVADLARRFRANLSRRMRGARDGRLDVRRTIRWSLSTGGVPLLAAFRNRRPGAPDFVGLCDCSHSVANATRFLIGLLHPAPQFFRRVRFFAFVDRAVEISIERGSMVPHERLDLYARSDFGKTLVGFWERYQTVLTRNTIVLILGDARNNRRPPRADILARIQSAVLHVAWLNPEPSTRWNTGDSVIDTYRRYCDRVFVASTPRELYTAFRRSTMRS